MKDNLIIEYVWIDGSKPTAQLRSKCKVVKFTGSPMLSDIPEWNFDGSSTGQADGSTSDVTLVPVRLYKNSFYASGFVNYAVLCECMDKDGKPLESNTRHRLAALPNTDKVMVGFEQEYVFMDMETERPIGFPERKELFPRPQGPYYCGVGANDIGSVCRKISEEHMAACLECGIMFYGTNAEVMLGQWEFQIGPRDKDDDANPLRVSDDLWMARFLLERIAEQYGVWVSYDAKPLSGDWNGSGCHLNASTNKTREPNGIIAIYDAINKIEAKYDRFINICGHGVKERLTGHHETCDWQTFKYGEADRSASIRIPQSVVNRKSGYFELRAPSANIDPYVVSEFLISTISE